MAAVALTNQVISRAGLTVSMVTPDAVDGVTFNNRGKNVFLLVENASASPVNVTIEVVSNIDGLVIPDRVVAVAAGALKAIGPFPAMYNDTDDLVTATFDSVVTVTAAALVLGAL